MFEKCCNQSEFNFDNQQKTINHYNLFCFIFAQHRIFQILFLTLQFMTGGHRKLLTFNLPTKGENNHQQKFT